MTETLRTLPAQKVFVPRISHTSMGARVIPLILAGAAYDSGAFAVRGYNKLEVFNRANRKGQIYVYMGPNPASLLLSVPGDGSEKALFKYAELAVENGIFPVEQFSVQVAADYARIVYLNDAVGPQTTWEFQIQAKPVAEPDGIRVFDEELPSPLTTVYKYLTMTPDYRLRVDGEFSPTSIQLVQGKQETIVWSAGDNGILAAATWPAVADNARFSIGMPIAGHASVEGSLKEFTIHAAIRATGTGSGWIVIEHMTSGAGAWIELDRLPLAPRQFIAKTYKATAERYRVYYLAGLNTTGFDGNLVLKPQT